MFLQGRGPPAEVAPAAPQKQHRLMEALAGEMLVTSCFLRRLQISFAGKVKKVLAVSCAMSACRPLLLGRKSSSTWLIS